jgi:hypothetical protein
VLLRGVDVTLILDRRARPGCLIDRLALRIVEGNWDGFEARSVSEERRLRGFDVEILRGTDARCREHDRGGRSEKQR